MDSRVHFVTSHYFTRYMSHGTELRKVNNELRNYGKKIKASHTRYRTLGPELIPVYRQSART